MDLKLIVLAISLLILLSGSIYKKLQDISLTEPFLALVLGIVLGPDVLNLIKSEEPALEFKVLKLACEFTIAMALMASALRLPQKFFRKNATTQSSLVIFGMVLMWLFSAGIFYLILPAFSLAECLLLGAIVTPTDPVVASTIITGKKAKKYLPGFVRNSLTFEAGVNDGFAYPIVFLSIFLVGSSSFSFSEWFTRILLYENVLCAILAYGVGAGAGFAMKKAHKSGWMNKKTLLPFSIALSLLLLSGFDLLKMNGIIAVFAGGLAFAKDITRNEEIEEERIQESMERITTTPVFFIFGLMLPWNEWFSLGWTAVGIVVLILLFRRIPALLMLMPVMPKFRRKYYSTMIMGWFGPIGVAALYYAIHSKEKAHFDEAWIIPALLVFASTIMHGLTSVPFEKWYHKKRSSSNENFD